MPASPYPSVRLPARAPRRTVCLIRTPGLGWQILRRALAELPEVAQVTEAFSAAQALATIPVLQPQVVISTPVLAEQSTVPLLAALRGACPDSRLALFGPTFPPEELSRFSQVGVTGFLLEDLPFATFRHCLAALLHGPVIVASPGVGPLFAPAAGAAATLTALSLSHREQRILRLLAAGCTHAHIARLEQLGVRTVERGVAALAAKLGAPSAFVLGMKAVQLGLALDGADTAAVPAWRVAATARTPMRGVSPEPRSPSIERDGTPRGVRKGVPRWRAQCRASRPAS